MGRRAQDGWTIRWHGGAASVRFRHEGKRVEFGLGTFTLPSGTRDLAGARQAAALRYAETIAGRRGPDGVTPPLPLQESIAAWLDACDGSYDKETIKTWILYGRGWLAFFQSWVRVHEGTIADYGRARLRKVLKKTVSKEISALRNFLAYCVERRWLSAVPVIADLPKKATGVRSGPQRAKSVRVTEEEIDRFLAALPEESERGLTPSGPRWPVRAFFVVAWETGLRPETIRCLSVPDHYTRGKATLTITPDVDKVRFDRELPISARARAALDQVAPDAGPIFGRHSYAKQVSKACVAAEMPKGFAPYDLRHARATAFLEASGDDVLGTGYLLGHKRATTTAIYLHSERRHGESVLALGEAKGRLMEPPNGPSMAPSDVAQSRHGNQSESERNHADYGEVRGKGNGSEMADLENSDEFRVTDGFRTRDNWSHNPAASQPNTDNQAADRITATGVQVADGREKSQAEGSPGEFPQPDPSESPALAKCVTGLASLRAESALYDSVLGLAGEDADASAPEAAPAPRGGQ